MVASTKPKTPVEADRQVGATIATLRKALGISQSDLGRACGVTFQQVQKYEAGRNRIGAGRLHQIAQHLGVPVGALLAPADAPASGARLQRLDAPGVPELLRAFASIPTDSERRMVLDMVRAAARCAQPKETAA